MVLVAPNGIAQGETITFELQFYYSPYVNPLSTEQGQVPSDSVSIRVLSGMPNQ